MRLRGCVFSRSLFPFARFFFGAEVQAVHSGELFAERYIAVDDLD
jgi:hypothetical protein